MMINRTLTAIALCGLLAAAACAQIAPSGPLTVNIVSPSSGTVVTGFATLQATTPAGPNLTGIQFKLDGADLGLKGYVSPHVMSWDSLTVPDGPHLLSVVATNAEGASATAAASIVVANLPPVIYSIGTASVGPTSATVLWFTTTNADSQADFGPSPTYGSSSLLDSTFVSTHTVTLIGLMPGTTYHYRVRSRHMGGVQAVSDDYSFTTPGSASPAGVALSDGSTARSNRRFLTPANADAAFGPDAQEVTIYDLRGRLVFHGTGSPIVWNSRGSETGVYIAKIKSMIGTVYQSLAVAR